MTPIIASATNCKPSKSLKIINKAINGKTIYSNANSDSKSDYKLVSSSIECIISSDMLSMDGLQNLSNQFKKSGISYLESGNLREGKTRFHFAQKLIGAARDKCTSKTCISNNLYFQGTMASAEYFLRKKYSNIDRYNESTLQLAYIQLRKSIDVNPNISRPNITSLLYTLEMEAPYLSSYTGQVYTGEAIGGSGTSIKKQILTAATVLAIAAVATGKAIDAVKSSAPPTRSTKSGPCLCGVKSIKDEGWIIENGYSTIKFENGKTADVKYVNGKYKVMGWFFNDYYNSYSEMMKKLVKDCKTKENCN